MSVLIFWTDSFIFMKTITKKDKKRLDELYSKLNERAENFLGYPSNRAYDYKEIERFLSLPINNVGDPFDDNLYGVNTHEFEREVLDFFAKLYHMPKKNYWGYVTHGGTEGNMYGLYLAREMCPGGIVYFSEDTHYSVPKIVRVLGMTHIVVRSQANGEMSYDDLREILRMNRDKPVIILANIGTTMKGAADNIEKIEEALRNNAIRRSYIHCDAALGGMILPFVKNAPVFDFRTKIDSIAVSGHKFIGMPFPSGVVIAKKHNVERVKTAIEYIGAADTTISGSRNGITPLMLWLAIRRLGQNGFKEQVIQVLRLTAYTVEQLTKKGWDAWANNYYNTVVIKRPSKKVIKKWQLAVQGDIAHIVIMPHTKKEQIDGLVADLEL
jgi:histidine decarboxylase